MAVRCARGGFPSPSAAIRRMRGAGVAVSMLLASGCARLPPPVAGDGGMGRRRQCRQQLRIGPGHWCGSGTAAHPPSPGMAVRRKGGALAWPQEAGHRRSRREAHPRTTRGRADAVGGKHGILAERCAGSAWEVLAHRPGRAARDRRGWAMPCARVAMRLALPMVKARQPRRLGHAPGIRRDVPADAPWRRRHGGIGGIGEGWCDLACRLAESVGTAAARHPARCCDRCPKGIHETEAKILEFCSRTCLNFLHGKKVCFPFGQQLTLVCFRV
jgi:hypothetical protein